MDSDAKKKIISAMLLHCLAGDIAVRINYGGILISWIEDYIVTEVVLKDPNHSYLIKILTAVDTIVESSLIVKLQNQLSSDDLSEIKKIIVEKIFPIDPSWATDEAIAR
jgi:hypothetical protein